MLGKNQNVMTTIGKITKKIKVSAPSSINQDELLLACRVALRKEVVQGRILLIVGICGVAIYIPIGGAANVDSAAKLAIVLPALAFYSFRARSRFVTLLKTTYPAVYEKLQSNQTRAQDSPKGLISTGIPADGTGLLPPLHDVQRQSRGAWVILFVIAACGVAFAAWKIKNILAEKADIAAMSNEYDAGCLDEGKGDFRGATTHFGRVVDRGLKYVRYLQSPRSQDQPVLTLLSQVDLHFGKMELASGAFKRAAVTLGACLSLRPNTAEALANRAMAYVRDGQSDRAVADASQAIALNPKDAIAYDVRAYALIEKGLIDKAMADIDQALHLDPGAAAALLAQGEAYFRNGDVDRAVAEYDEALRIKPDLAMGYQLRADARRSQGRLGEAAKDYDEVIQREPNNVGAYQLRAKLRKDLGNEKGAAEDLLKAKKITNGRS